MIDVPFSSDYDQRFITQLGDAKYRFDARWNERGQAWSFDLTRDSDQVQLLAGAPLQIGQDVLAPYALGIGGLIVSDLGRKETDAGPDDLGTRVIVTYLSPDELAAIKAILGPFGASIVTGGVVPPIGTPRVPGSPGASTGSSSIVYNTTVNETINNFTVDSASGGTSSPEMDDASGNEIMIARFIEMPGLNPNPTISMALAVLARGNGTIRAYVGGIFEDIGSTGTPSGTAIGTPAAVTADGPYQITGSLANPGGLAAVKVTMQSSAPATNIGVALVKENLA